MCVVSCYPMTLVDATGAMSYQSRRLGNLRCANCCGPEAILQGFKLRKWNSSGGIGKKSKKSCRWMLLKEDMIKFGKLESDFDAWLG